MRALAVAAPSPALIALAAKATAATPAAANAKLPSCQNQLT
jgi:hypothetical protein